MTFIPLTSDNIEIFTLETKPHRTYVSGNNVGVTGSIYLFQFRSQSEKDIFVSSSLSYDDSTPSNLETMRVAIVNSANTNINSDIANYMSSVNAKQSSRRKDQQLFIKRTSTDDCQFKSVVTSSFKKSQIKKNLFPFYRNAYGSMHNCFTNYHALNFFTSSNVPSNTALLYPNFSASAASTAGLIAGDYVPSGAFTIEFYINPRYTTRVDSEEFNAGTILHLSSTFAVSLLTGSSRDVNGLPNTYRLLLQLSNSADVNPSRVTIGTTPCNFAFLTSDNLLKRNSWHHVAIRWGTPDVNLGTGSFVIDGREIDTFVITSSRITPQAFVTPLRNPDVLFIGNYYEGQNITTNRLSSFFSDAVSQNNGTDIMETTQVKEPGTCSLQNPLNAELHELKIYSRYKTLNEIFSSSIRGVDIEQERELLFYVPPFFTKESPYRNKLYTPFANASGSTIDPFNVDLSFTVLGRDINLENFCREFKKQKYPVLLNLTSSAIPVPSAISTANDHLFNISSHRKRNLTVLPNDNGMFVPSFRNLLTSSIVLSLKSGSQHDKYIDDLNILDLSKISLSNMLHSSTMGTITTNTLSVFTPNTASTNGLYGPTPDQLTVPAHEIRSVHQLTGESDSNEIAIFEIDQIFYGNQIRPTSFRIFDESLSCSNGRIQINLRDDGFGNLYRADSATPNARWNSVGNIIYDEGLAVIQAPTLLFFGKNKYLIEFDGLSTTHVMRLNVFVPGIFANSSSNVTYKNVSASFDANDLNQKFVYVTNMNVHDENLNVVMKSQFAQPIIKREGDRFMVKTRIDF